MYCAMRFFENRRSHAILPHNGLEPRQRHIQLGGLRHLPCEEAKLDQARLAGLGGQARSSYGSLWRVDANLQLQEFQQKLVIDGGERRPDDAFVTFSAFELHPDREQRNG
jgi:hypothetical protein